MYKDDVNKVDAHLDAHESKGATAAKAGLSADSAKLFDLCGEWQKISPILKFVSKYLLFWKPKWRDFINKYIAIADGICPTP